MDLKGLKMKDGIRIEKTCLCGRKSYIDLTKEEYRNYTAWQNKIIYIQDIGTLNPCEREFLKTGLCRKCQKEIFDNNKTERIKVAR